MRVPADLRAVLSFVAVAILVALAGCATTAASHPVALALPAASAAPSALSAMPAGAVHVGRLLDMRKGFEGNEVEALGVSMGRVTWAEQPTAVVASLVRAELTRAGHRESDAPDAVQVTGSVRDFEVHTDSTPLYWDVLGHVAVTMQFAAPGKAPASLDYDVKCSDRTYIWPGESVLAGTMEKCLADLAARFRDDPAVAAALGH